MTHDDLWQEWTRKGIDALAVFDVDPNDYYATPPHFLHSETSLDDFSCWKEAQDKKLKDDLKGEYYGLSRELHSDRLQGFSPKLISQATRLFSNITEVYEVLTDPERYEALPAHDISPPTSPMMEYVQSLHATGLRIRDHPARRDVELLLAKKALALELRTTTDPTPATQQQPFPSPDLERYRQEATEARAAADRAKAEAEDYKARWRQCSSALSRYEILGSPEEVIRLPQLVEQLREMGTLRAALQELQTELNTVQLRAEEREAAIALFAELTSGRTRTPPYGFSPIDPEQAAVRLRATLRRI